MNFKIVGEIENVEPIAEGLGIRENRRLKKSYGGKKWRKLKGTAMIEFSTGRIRRVELHWYEANGVGKKEIKIKRYLG